ncbi:MAG TPA: YggT family protein [Candidatus Binatia bacterium]|nr:YggT family protein [Candidatus Binatia bacterium]
MPCSLLAVLHQLITIYVVIMLVYAVVSWIPSIRGRWTDYVAMLVEPVLRPVRRIIPPLGGLDLSFLIVIILLQVVDGSLRGVACT